MARSCRCVQASGRGGRSRKRSLKIEVVWKIRGRRRGAGSSAGGCSGIGGGLTRAESDAEKRALLSGLGSSCWTVGCKRAGERFSLPLASGVLREGVWDRGAGAGFGNGSALTPRGAEMVYERLCRRPMGLLARLEVWSVFRAAMSLTTGAHTRVLGPWCRLDFWTARPPCRISCLQLRT